MYYSPTKVRLIHVMMTLVYEHFYYLVGESLQILPMTISRFFLLPHQLFEASYSRGARRQACQDPLYSHFTLYPMLP